MQHLFSVWSDIAQRVRLVGQVLLLADYDGTLTPIVSDPQKAGLDDKTRLRLQALARERGVSLGVISGRSLFDLKDRINIGGLIYAGNHGLEIEGPDLSFIDSVATESRPKLDLLSNMLGKALRRVKGAEVENKGLTLSVHYRNVDDAAVNDVKNIFGRVLAAAALRGVRTTSGKKVLEVRPSASWDKGKAIDFIISCCKGKQNLLPIYVGDDITDEDGFKAIALYNGGLSVFVGRGKGASNASYFLKNPDEVSQFLAALLWAKQAARPGLAGKA